MSYKRIIPCLFIWQGKAVKWFDDQEVLSEDAVSLAKHYSDAGADELLVFDLSDFFCGKRCLIFQKRASGQINRRQSQCFIHREKEKSKTADSPFISCRLGNGFTDYNAGIFYRMMRIHLQIPLHMDFQIKQPMSGKALQHMVKKANSIKVRFENKEE